ncbi:MAG: VOC family protein [Nitrospinaceae bacterium]|nr:VOC family protein [Nitrospinaceae bacterium]
MKITIIDHFVLTVRSIPDTCAFYERVLGMKAAKFGGRRWALLFGHQKINLHQVGKEFEPNAKSPVAGAGDFCLISGEPLSEVVRQLNEAGIPIEMGPVSKSGAKGPIMSVYIRDPDENLVEISEYE